MKLRPSPSPDYLPPPERSPTPEPSRSSTSKKKRRPKTQASQGDAVLIGFMGGLNHPDLATRAGEEPLPQSDDSDIDIERMDADDGEATNEDNYSLVHLAENALSSVESHDGRCNDPSSASKTEHTRPARPTILTPSRASASNGTICTKIRNQDHPQHQDSAQSVPPSSSNGNVSKPAHSPSRSMSSGKDDSDSVAISPMLRRFTIPNSERSPAETLPAMHNSPPSSSSKSPISQQNLPSLRAIALEPLLDTRSPKEIAPHGISRPPYSMGDGTLNSPPASSMTPRTGQYCNPQIRTNEHLNSPHPAGHLSPANNDISPNSTNMSPPTGKPAFPNSYPNGRTPHSEGSTPQSAESHHSSSSFSTAPSPHGYPLDIDRGRPTLPPLIGLQSGPMMTGSFKCDYAGCSAAPFQTQYLLK